MRDDLGRSYATGKRKDAVARVWVKPGSGKVTVNGKEMAKYFARPVLQMVIGQPFTRLPVSTGQFDVMATVKGGGLSGQAGAVKHGISKALTISMTRNCARALKAAGFLTRDSPRRRAEEVRPPQGPSELPVLEALIRSRLDSTCLDHMQGASRLFRWQSVGFDSGSVTEVICVGRVRDALFSTNGTMSEDSRRCHPRVPPMFKGAAPREISYSWSARNLARNAPLIRSIENLTGRPQAC